MKNDVVPFAKAWVATTLVAGSPFAAIGLMMSVDAVSQSWFLPAMLLWPLLPLAVAGCLALVAMVVFVIPATCWLRVNGAESRRAYRVIGAVAGAATGAVVAVVLSGDIALPPALLFAGLGALSGGAAGLVWGRYRVPAHRSIHARPPNPIHELLH